jgi:formyl-CoA transferase
LGGARHGPDFQNLHRNKRSITLDLKKPEGLAIFLRLVKGADVVVENFRPDVKHRLGIDYASLKEVNPGLVYASISGFGQDGPYRDLPGYDQVAQGLGGIMSVTGLPGQGPVRTGVPIADLSSGLYCAIGILVALLGREASGQGQWVQTSLLQAQIAMLDFQAARWLMNGEIPQQAGNYHPTSVPTGVYPTSDGFINLAVTGAAIYERFCKVVDRPEWLTDPRFASSEARGENRDALNTLIDGILVSRSSQDWLALLNEASVPCGPINRIDQTFDDPQVKHLGMAHRVVHPTLGPIDILAQAVRLSDTPFEIHSPTPEAGEHTAEVLEELGMPPEEIVQLKKRGVI